MQIQHCDGLRDISDVSGMKTAHCCTVCSTHFGFEHQRHTVCLQHSPLLAITASKQAFSSKVIDAVIVLTAQPKCVHKQPPVALASSTVTGYADCVTYHSAV